MAVRCLVTETSVLPDTEAIAVEYEAVRATFGEDVRPPLWLGALGARKRGSRLRRCWGGRYGIVRPREILPAAEMLAKADLRHGSAALSSVTVSTLKGAQNPLLVKFGTVGIKSVLCHSSDPCYFGMVCSRQLPPKWSDCGGKFLAQVCLGFAEICVGKWACFLAQNLAYCGGRSHQNLWYSVVGIWAAFPAQIPAMAPMVSGRDPNWFLKEK